MANKRTTKEQVIIDFKYKEIKVTTKELKRSLEFELEDHGDLREWNLREFKIVTSLTEDKIRAPKNFKPITYKTRKRDIISYLETIKDSEKQVYNEYMEALEEDDFVVINKKFNEEVITTDEKRKKLQEIIEENNILIEQEEKEKERKRQLREQKREQRQKEREEKKKQLQNN